MTVHEVAEEGFGRAAETYERVRPSYPADAVAWLVHNLRIEPDRTVLDLAAGTGKFTRLLAPLGATLFAAEPVD
ncbi:MAG TPA: SAM-dependent methyltransferase, partial [Acidimicrobiia bacterium]|nr:SAM-dependent methyltransferase [Acidimicrobiia bacterium]